MGRWGDGEGVEEEESWNWRMMSPAPEEDFKSADMAVDSCFSAFRLDEDIAAAARPAVPPWRQQTGVRRRGDGAKARSRVDVEGCKEEAEVRPSGTR